MSDETPRSKSTRSRLYCCVDGCKSCAYRDYELSFHTFPKADKYNIEITNNNGTVEKVDARKLWERNLKFNRKITDITRVCSKHFVQSDFFPQVDGSNKKSGTKRSRLKRTAYPTRNLPMGPLETTRKRKRNPKYEAAQPIVKPNHKSMSDETAPTIQNVDIGNSAETANTRCNSRRKVQLKKDVPIKPRTKAQLRSLVNERSRIKGIQEDSTKLVSRRGRKKKTVAKIKGCENCLSSQNNSNKPTSTSVGVQTDKLEDFDVENNRDNDNQKSLGGSIDYLRKNLLGHVVRSKGNTLTINECSISFKDENSEEKNVLIIQSDTIVSTGTLLLEALLGNCELERLQQNEQTNKQLENIYNEANHSNQPQEFDQSYEAPQNCVVKIEDEDTLSADEFTSAHFNCNSTQSTENSTLDTNYDNEKNSTTENITTKEFIQVFDKELKVLVNKLPENLYKAIQDGHKVRVRSKENIKNFNVDTQQKPAVENIKVTPKGDSDGHKVRVRSKENIKNFNVDTQQKPAIENIKVTPKGELDKLENVESGMSKQILPKMANEHVKIHQNVSITEKIKEKDHNVNEDSIDVVKPYGSQKVSTRKRKKYICEICGRIFDHFQSLKFHTHTIHYWENKVENQSIESENCEELLGDNGKCPECLCVCKNRKELDVHLLDCHRIVLKKLIYECEICWKTFITYKSLAYHKITFHDIPMNENVLLKLKCSVCKKLIEANEYRTVHFKNCSKNLEEEKKTEKTTVVQEISKDSNKAEQPNISNQEESSANTNEVNIEEPINERKRIMTSSFVSQVDNLKEKRLKIEDKPESNPADGSSCKILDRLKDLLGSNDGLNEITIELDD